LQVVVQVVMAITVVVVVVLEGYAQQLLQLGVGEILNHNYN
jgi:hypothetical protein